MPAICLQKKTSRSGSGRQIAGTATRQIPIAQQYRTAGPRAGVTSVLFYLVGLFISIVMAFLITLALVGEDEVRAV